MRKTKDGGSIVKTWAQDSYEKEQEIRSQDVLQFSRRGFSTAISEISGIWNGLQNRLAKKGIVFPSPFSACSDSIDDKVLPAIRVNYRKVAKTPPTVPWYSKGYLTLYKFHQVPTYLQDNDFILDHYRAHYTFKENWISLFHLHNEFGNVWTHLIAFAIFLVLLVDLIQDYGILEWSLNVNGRGLTWWDRCVISGYIVGTMIGFLCSSMFHLHLCADEKAYKFFGCLDYSGISLIIFSSTSSLIYYTFYCHPTAGYAWITLLFFVNLTGVVGPFTPNWAGPAFRPLRSAVYILSGACTLAPLCHYIYFVESGSSQLPGTDEFALWALPMSIGVYLIGVLVYIARIPERFSPGTFDLFFHSHQIWHVLVFLGAFVHLQGCLAWAEWRLTNQHC